MFKKLLGKSSSSSNDKDKRRVIVLTCDHGLVGKNILPALVSRQLLEVYAGVNEAEAHRLKPMDGVTILKTDMDDKKAIHKMFKSKKFDRIILVVPNNRPDWAENTLEAADHTKSVKFVCVISVLTAPLEDTFFGLNCSDLEKAAKYYFPFGYCIVRLPLLMESMVPLCAKSIKEKSSFSDPRNPDKPFRCISMEDVAKAVMHIITKPSKHGEKIYHLTGPSITLRQQAAALGKVLKKDIVIEQEDYEQFQENLEKKKVPEWQVQGTFEIYRMIDTDSELVNMDDPGDYEQITGEKPTTLEIWCKKNAGLFK